MKAMLFGTGRWWQLVSGRIGELLLSDQVKLLRFLENGRLTRPGGSKVPFRQDLYYRLNVPPLHLPPLRERKDCISPLIRYYVDYFEDIAGIRKRVSSFTLDALLLSLSGKR